MDQRILLPSGGELALRQWGRSGPAVLLHHATGLCKAVWGEIAEALAAHCRLFAYDIRGHGDSDARTDALSWQGFGRDMAAVAGALVARMGAPLRLAVGHSLGGVATLYAAEHAPGLFERALLLDPVLLDAAAVQRRRSDVRRAVLRTRLRQVEFPGRQQARAALAEHDLYRTWSRRVIDDFVAEAFATTERGTVVLKCEPATEATIYGLGETDIVARLDRLPIEAEIMASHISPFAKAYTRIEQDHPHVRLSWWKVGHMLPMEAPDQVVCAIARMCEVRLV